MDERLKRTSIKLHKTLGSTEIPDDYLLRESVFKWFKRLANTYNMSVYEIILRMGFTVSFDAFGNYSICEKLKIFEYDGVINGYYINKVRIKSAIISQIRITNETMIDYCAKHGYTLENSSCCKIPYYNIQNVSNAI